MTRSELKVGRKEARSLEKLPSARESRIKKSATSESRKAVRRRRRFLHSVPRSSGGGSATTFAERHAEAPARPR
jgi:hypothetical protein